VASRYQAFEDLYVREADRLQLFLLRRVDDPDDAEDMTQEAWARMHQQFQQQETIDNPKALLYTIARNLLTDFYRHRSRTRLIFAGELPEHPEPGVPPARSEYDQERLRRALEISLERLSPEQREAILATEIDGKSFKELAEGSGTQLGTWLSRKYYGMRKLQQFLKVVYEEFLNTL
jgi:RNA polymerase sigma factor (sigma-70 family)